MFCQSCSVYLTVFISLERWIAVCTPLQAKHLCTQFRWKKSSNNESCWSSSLQTLQNNFLFRTRLAVIITSLVALGNWYLLVYRLRPSLNSLIHFHKGLDFLIWIWNDYAKFWYIIQSCINPFCYLYHLEPAFLIHIFEKKWSSSKINITT